MIRRREADGYVLVSRAEQCRLAALLASSIGGAFLQPSSPDLIAGVLMVQGVGFAEAEREWPLDAAGRPASAEDLPLVARVRAWDAAADACSRFGPYAELLSSVLALRQCANAARQTRTMRDAFEVNRLQQRQIERQQRLRPAIGLRNDVPIFSGLAEDSVTLLPTEAQFDYDVRLTMLLEQIAWHICALRMPVVLAGAPTGPGAERVTVAIRPRGPGRIVLQPFPLANEIGLIIAGRLVSDRIYDHEREFHNELRDAPERRLRVRICP